MITHGDFEAFAGALAPDIVWVGVAPGLLCRIIEMRDYPSRRAALEAVGL